MFCPCETSISVHDPQPNDQPYAAKLLDSVGIMVGITYSPKITRLEVTPGKGSFGVRTAPLKTTTASMETRKGYFVFIVHGFL
jgi:hypothetical protein